MPELLSEYFRGTGFRTSWVPSTKLGLNQIGYVISEQDPVLNRKIAILPKQFDSTYNNFC